MNNKDFGRYQDGRALVGIYPGASSVNHFERVNRWDIPEGFAYLDGLRGYVFMTRPDCNIIDRKTLNLTEQATKHLGFNEFAGNSRNPDPTNLYITRLLTRNTGYPSSFILPITNYIKGYSPEDQRLDTVEHGENYYSSKLKYAKHSGQSRTAGSITLNFNSDKHLFLYKLICLWTEYAEQVYLGRMSPRREYIWSNEIDYAASFFFLAVRNTGEGITPPGSKKKKEVFEIVYWEKKDGIFPVTRPDSGFAYTKGQFIEPEFSVQFDYSIPSKSSILDPYVLSEFNVMVGWQHNKTSLVEDTYQEIMSSSKPGTIVRDPGNHHVTCPNIFRQNGKFWLEWLK